MVSHKPIIDVWQGSKYASELNFNWYRCDFLFSALKTLVGIYLFKVNNENTKTIWEICWKLTIKTFIVNFGLVSQMFWCFHCWLETSKFRMGNGCKGKNLKEFVNVCECIYYTKNFIQTFWTRFWGWSAIFHYPSTTPRVPAEKPLEYRKNIITVRNTLKNMTNKLWWKDYFSNSYSENFWINLIPLI